MFHTIIISPPSIDDEHIPVISEILKEDILFHIRIREKDSMYTSEVLNKIEKKHHSKIVLHQDFYLAKEYNIRGIHLSEENRPAFSSYVNEGYNLVSASIHLLRNYDVIRHSYEYVMYSPVFPSVSKKGYGPQKTFDDIREELKTLMEPQQLIALGGITLENISEIKKAGFGGVAILGSVWESNDPVSIVKELSKSVETRFNASY